MPATDTRTYASITSPLSKIVSMTSASPDGDGLPAAPPPAGCIAVVMIPPGPPYVLPACAHMRTRRAPVSAAQSCGEEEQPGKFRADDRPEACAGRSPSTARVADMSSCIPVSQAYRGQTASIPQPGHQEQPKRAYAGPAPKKPGGKRPARQPVPRPPGPPPKHKPRKSKMGGGR
jgi:hypothetical protein